MSGRSPPDCIRNEAEVVTSICRNGGHQNIIRVLRHGWLGGSVNVYFIDMELASLTLEEYLDYQRNLQTPGVDVEAIAASRPVFIHKDCSPIEQIENMWAIGMHIARGLEFMHSLKHVHRDLKPSNG
jgi:serine/threonine protein kinase